MCLLIFAIIGGMDEYFLVFDEKYFYFFPNAK